MPPPRRARGPQLIELNLGGLEVLFGLQDVVLGLGAYLYRRVKSLLCIGDHVLELFNVFFPRLKRSLLPKGDG